MLVIKYNSSVLTAAGWRSVTILATAKEASAKRVTVDTVELIDGLSPSQTMSRTGSKRQQFDGLYFAGNESGKIKNISSLISCDFTPVYMRGIE